MRHRYAILDAPSALGHIPEHVGVERAPGVLLEAGVADGLGARRSAAFGPSAAAACPIRRPG
jgi:hypothetical protein